MEKTSFKGKVHSVAKKLNDLRKRGQRSIYIFYTRDVNGKRIPNYKRIAITSGVIAAAAGGAYAYYRHKKYGHVIRKKKKDNFEGM